MIDLKVGDKVQVDPALVNGGARHANGAGIITKVGDGGTKCRVQWSFGITLQHTRGLVLVSSAPGGAQ